MSKKEFKLPISSSGEIKKLMTAYAKAKAPSSLAHVSKLTGMYTTAISGNNGFLESINAIKGGNSKEASEVGKKLGLAFANNIESEIESNLKELLEATEFIESMITALGIKPRTSDEFQSHVAYSLGKELKSTVATGTKTLVELLKTAGMIEEKDGLLYPKATSIERKADATATQKQKLNDGDDNENEPKNSFAKQLTKNLGNNVTLNINIQLTIPETENEKVYENFFEAMKKHLLA